MNIDFLIIGYFYLGIMAVKAVRSVYVYYVLKSLSQHTHNDILYNTPYFKSRCFITTIFWPLFMKPARPFVLLCEVLFQQYGDEGHRYFGLRSEESSVFPFLAK